MQNENAATLAEVIAVEAGAVAPVETGETSAPVETATASKPKRKPRKSKPAVESKPAAAPVKRDEWHVKIGGSGHVINKWLRGNAKDKPRSIAEIHAATTEKGGRATAGATRGHVMFLLARGYVKMKDGGYIVSKKGGKPAAEKPAAESEAETGE